MKLDVIIPSYNEDGNIEIIHKELTKVLKDIKYTLIFVDDGSTDHTLAKLKDIYNKDKRHVRVLSFSRNFGKDAAIYAGMSVSNAEYTVVIDADMQQNPKYIIEMLEYIEKHPELLVLSISRRAGLHIIAAKDGRQFFVTGHAEYDRDTLAKEYFRDVNKGLAPKVPYNYFPNDDPSETPPFTWRSNGHLLLSNWLNYYVYQQTPYDLQDLRKLYGE